MEIERLCARCDGPLPSPSRADRRYCTDACRQAAYEDRQRQARVELLRADGPERAESASRLERLRAAIVEATREERLVGVIAAESRTNWRASAWLLSRMHPERWGERGRDVPFTLGDDPEDPFAEVDQIAEARRRREQKKPPGY
jgi:hypothetical protein